MQRPAFILADEPAASLSPDRRGCDGSVAQRRAGKGLSLLMISHRLDHMLQFSDRILRLAQGQIALDLPTAPADAAGLRRFFDRQEPS